MRVFPRCEPMRTLFSHYRTHNTNNIQPGRGATEKLRWRASPNILDAHIAKALCKWEWFLNCAFTHTRARDGVNATRIHLGENMWNDGSFWFISMRMSFGPISPHLCSLTLSISRIFYGRYCAYRKSLLAATRGIVELLLVYLFVVVVVVYWPLLDFFHTK